MADAAPAGDEKKKVVSKPTKGAAADGAVDNKKKFEVKKVRMSSEWRESSEANMSQWNAVALWAWDIVVDNCAICRNHIMDLCRFCSKARYLHGLTFIRHRMSSQPGRGYYRGVYCRMGHMQPRFPLSLHLEMAQNSSSLSS